MQTKSPLVFIVTVLSVFALSTALAAPGSPNRHDSEREPDRKKHHSERRAAKNQDKPSKIDRKRQVASNNNKQKTNSHRGGNNKHQQKAQDNRQASQRNRSHEDRKHHTSRRDHKDSQDQRSRHQNSRSHGRSGNNDHNGSRYADNRYDKSRKHHSRWYNAFGKHHDSHNRHQKSNDHFSWAFGFHNRGRHDTHHVNYDSYVSYRNYDSYRPDWHTAGDFRTRQGRIIERTIDLYDHVGALEIEGTGRGMFIHAVYIESDDGGIRHSPELEGYYGKGDYRTLHFAQNQHIRRIHVEISATQGKRGYARVNYRRY